MSYFGHFMVDIEFRLIFKLIFDKKPSKLFF